MNRPSRLGLVVAVVLALVATTVSASYADDGARKRKPKYGVTATAASANVPLGSAITLSGHVGPNAHGKVLRLQRRSGARWVTVASTTLNTRSNYAVSWRPASYGTYSLRVLKPAGSGRRAGTSASRAVVVRTVASVVGGYQHTCALITDGTVRCWGDNSARQLGNAAAGTLSTRPVRVTGISTARQISSGTQAQWTCALLATGSVVCWGSNSDGLGAPATTSSAVPVRVQGISTATQVSVGSSEACARLRNGSVRCWGRNTNGSLGNGEASAANSDVPVTVATLTDATQVSVGGDHVCAVRATGAVRCWGADQFGQLGDGSGNSTSDVPRTVSGLADATSISAGTYHTCARRSGGQVVCWGFDGLGSLGDNDSGGSNKFVPVPVVDLGPATSVSAGYYHVCARTTSGSPRCWGASSNGQVGAGDTNATHLNADPVLGGPRVLSLGVGAYHSCALLTNRSVRCWGWNYYGQLGNGASGNSTDSAVPVVVRGLP